MREWHEAIIEQYPGAGIKNLDLFAWADADAIVHTVNVYPLTRCSDPYWVTRCMTLLKDARIETVTHVTNCMRCMAASPL